MTREQAMEWILTPLHALDASSHLPQPIAGPSNPKSHFDARAAEQNACEAAIMESHGKARDRSAVTLSAEQQYVVDLVKQGCNVFFTGSAGTTHFIRLFL